jgi:hypothetical protein
MTGNHRIRIFTQWHHLLSVRGSVIALLALYLAAFISSPAGVPHLHHDATTVHDDSCQKDPCHAAIYHPGEKHHCDHKNHLSPADEACDLCKISVVPQDMPQTSLLTPVNIIVEKPAVSCCTQWVIHHVDHLANKGPPFVS